MRKKCVLVILVSILFFSALDNTQTFRAEISPTPTISQQEHFIVQQTFWAFGGTYAIGSFSANSGDYLVLNISSVNVDPDRPDDLYVVELDIVSAKHGTSYVSDTQFSQAIPLNYTDHYTITAEKHQFWSSVRISGELTVYHNPMPLATTSPSPTQQPTVSILYPLNASFFNVSIGGVSFPLTYETNSDLSWVGYSINGSNNVTLPGNGTYVLPISGYNGYNNLTVYANDTIGNWATPQTIVYLVNVYPDYTPTPSPSPTRQPTIEPSPTPIIDYYYWWLSPTVWAFAIACLFIALFAELKLRSRNRIKQKRDSNEKKNISKTNATSFTDRTATK